ncbi:hypothetical protein PHYSODRAFT_264794 [Phytophthora sojae]|uniref:Uncharacterized protein n=2 Tax=Phytophthora sojae TaxID=67593 RepID=G4ZYS6_PHYSP|nr:hypothetical protein PHYSODRAFT_264794 [Phytophthora sojae]AEK80606.1 Avh72 [Phytophthora sojae]AEK80607.1 Avh72 [Phytophthora sojae]AEK80608.1 Avh72 [Phytophthora sojae]EGZ12109.1 hypothetical protein PHYSODRAFT_264794 [Phytophthora sojae]|eukprot:XP_009532442.1 hypothetical protein PHYSODRAFT_264794 [Phytophthora sojae]
MLDSVRPFELHFLKNEVHFPFLKSSILNCLYLSSPSSTVARRDLLLSVVRTSTNVSNSAAANFETVAWSASVAAEKAFSLARRMAATATTRVLVGALSLGGRALDNWKEKRRMRFKVIVVWRPSQCDSSSDGNTYTVHVY